MEETLRKYANVAVGGLLAMALFLGAAYGLSAQKNGAQLTTIANASSSSKVAASVVPQLTDTQRLQILVKLQILENMQLRMEAAKNDLLLFAKPFERDGYELDLRSGTYHAVPPAALPTAPHTALPATSAKETK